MARGDDIQERLIDFAVEIIKLCASLPKTQAERHVAGQLLRCGTSPAPNYGEARGAESANDFVHKLRIVLKELNETDIWLSIISKSQLLPDAQVGPLKAEALQLTRIMGSSIQTVIRNKGAYLRKL